MNGENEVNQSLNINFEKLIKENIQKMRIIAVDIIGSEENFSNDLLDDEEYIVTIFNKIYIKLCEIQPIFGDIAKKDRFINFCLTNRYKILKPVLDQIHKKNELAESAINNKENIIKEIDDQTYDSKKKYPVRKRIFSMVASGITNNGNSNYGKSNQCKYLKKNNGNKNKIAITVLLIITILIALIPSTKTLFFENRLITAADKHATEYINEAIVRAGVAYTLARTFNAIVSVVQESEVQIEPGGLGVSLALGQALDPANDIVERFSMVLLASMASLGIQKILIEISPWLSINILLVFSIIMFLLAIWTRDKFDYDFKKVGKTMLLMALLVRFSVPAMAYLNNQVYITVLDNKHSAAMSKMSEDINKIKSQEDIEKNNVPQGVEQEEGSGWLDKTKTVLGQVIEQSKQTIQLKERLESIKTVSFGLFDTIIDLLIIFLINTILLPIAFLWGFVKLGQLLINKEFSEKQQNLLNKFTLSE